MVETRFLLRRVSVNFLQLFIFSDSAFSKKRKKFTCRQFIFSDNSGSSAADLAIFCPKTTAVDFERFLAETKIFTNRRNGGGLPPLAQAAALGRLDLCEALLFCGANISEEIVNFSATMEISRILRKWIARGSCRSTGEPASPQSLSR